MEPIRVIGRIDLAQQLHTALIAEGVDARLATAAPLAVVGQTGKDGTGVDVLAFGLDLCSWIKKAAPQRPIVSVIFEEAGTDVATKLARSAARTSRGPDVVVRWPATGRDLLDACNRATEAARLPRPRIDWRDPVPWVACGVVLLSGVLVTALFFRMIGGCEVRHRAVVASQLAQLLLLASGTWLATERARTSPRRRWHRGWVAVLGLLSLLVVIGSFLG